MEVLAELASARIVSLVPNECKDDLDANAAHDAAKRVDERLSVAFLPATCCEHDHVSKARPIRVALLRFDDKRESSSHLLSIP